MVGTEVGKKVQRLQYSPEKVEEGTGEGREGEASGLSGTKVGRDVCNTPVRTKVKRIEERIRRN